MTRFAALLALVVLACGCATTHAPKGRHIGEPILDLRTKKLADLMANPAPYVDRKVLIEGRIKAVCKKKGCWMQIEDGPHSVLVRWETGCGGRYAFPRDAVGERVIVQGSFYPKELSAKDAEHMREEAGAELDLARKVYEINADAVVLPERT